MRTKAILFVVKFVLFLAFVQKISLLSAQGVKGLPIGTWKVHLPFNDVKAVEKFNNQIYAATSSGIYALDPTTGEVSIISKIQGLSDVGVSIMRKHPEKELLFIGYENGNIDLIQNNKITNIPDLTISSITGSKQINAVDFYENEAYLACEFGLVILNLDKNEVKESNLTMGTNGQPVRVWDVHRFHDSLFCLTGSGLKSIKRSLNIQNTDLWTTYNSSDGIYSDPAVQKRIGSFCGKLVIGTIVDIKVMGIGHPKFTQLSTQGGDIRSMRSVGCQMLISVSTTDGSAILVMDTAGVVVDTLRSPFINQASDAIKTGEGEYWVGDLDNGLIKVANKEYTPFKPNGPVSLNCFKLYNFQDKMTFLSGGYGYPVGYGQSLQKAGFSIYAGNEWKNYNNGVNPMVPAIEDVVSARFNPVDQKLYLNSFGFGIMTMKDEKFEVMNDVTTNAGLCNILFPNDCRYDANDPVDNPASGGGYKAYVRITSCNFDLFNNLWVTNFGVKPNSIRIRLAKDQTWITRPLDYVNADNPLDILNDRNNLKWIRMAPNRGSSEAALWVISADGEMKKALNASPDKGALPSSDVYDVAEDKQGLIWVGTSKGLAVFYNPTGVFTEGGITASTPIFPPEAGRPVLENDIVTSIEIDGGNRKWVGTKSNGVWLFNSDITKVIQHFTAANSPLLSDQIVDLEINKPTGELFISTDRGVMSYQTDATENLDPSECLGGDVSIFPNPVVNGYDGPIAVKGLASNSTVKFVTASGKLVYQTTSEGGLATWNRITYDGQKAHPGIYIVLSSTQDGKANCISKLAILD